jgi:DNA-binding transcriptional ArsR family regulator
MSGRDRGVEGVFSALSDPTRRRVMAFLSERGPVSATDLAEELPVTRQAVAKHLAALEAAGLVASERRGRERRFTLTPGPLAEAMGWMTEVGAQWDRRLDALHRHLTHE